MNKTDNQQQQPTAAHTALNFLFRNLWLTVTAAAVLIVLMVWLIARGTGLLFSLHSDDDIEITPEQIQAIRDIGQWEFLAISDEELVDTTRRGFFSDDHLARIYYGTLRLGIDLDKVSDGWITAHGDTIVVLLPPIGLLDEHFIDEARTESFHESGRWTAADREAMYRKAKAQMQAHALTPQNLRSAEDNADAQLRKLLHGMGFSNVTIRFQPR